MTPFAFQPPYYAVIFASRRRDLAEGYALRIARVEREYFFESDLS